MNRTSSFQKIEMLAYLNKGQLFDKLRVEKQKMKIGCLEKCLDLGQPDLNPKERECLSHCRTKIDNFLRFSDDLYHTKFYHS